MPDVHPFPSFRAQRGIRSSRQLQIPHCVRDDSHSMSRVNDFAFKIATVNGTGSASANSLLMQAIFRMGIPVSGKNVFPSNSQGLPTWYEIRVSKDCYTARPADVDLVVALNPETYAKDVAAVRPGGYLLYDSSWPLHDALRREGITILAFPSGRCASKPSRAIARARSCATSRTRALSRRC